MNRCLEREKPNQKTIEVPLFSTKRLFAVLYGSKIIIQLGSNHLRNIKIEKLRADNSIEKPYYDFCQFLAFFS